MLPLQTGTDRIITKRTLNMSRPGDQVPHQWKARRIEKRMVEEMVPKGWKTRVTSQANQPAKSCLSPGIQGKTGGKVERRGGEDYRLGRF